MLSRLVFGFAALALAVPAHAQGSCVPASTPDVATQFVPPTLFSHCVEDGKCGAVDKTGAWRIPPKYSEILIEDDFFVVPQNEDWTRFAFLDADGKVLGEGDFAITFEESLPVSEGLLAVQVGEKTGFVDHTGKLVIPAEFDGAWAFANGLSGAQKGGKHFYIDRTGKTVLEAPAGVDEISGFTNGVAVVGKGGKYGLIDESGKIVLEPKFTSLYADGPVLVASEGESMGIVDRAGNWISKPDFLFIGAFSNGLAPAHFAKLEKWGVIDTCGNTKIEPKYDEIVGFEGGPARVLTGEKWGLIDQSGAELYPLQASFIGGGYWIDGLISYSINDTRFGLLDTSGKTALEPAYDSVEPLGNGVLISYTGEEEKLLNRDGTEIKIAPAP